MCVETGGGPEIPDMGQQPVVPMKVPDNPFEEDDDKDSAPPVAIGQAAPPPMKN